MAQERHLFIGLLLLTGTGCPPGGGGDGGGGTADGTAGDTDTGGDPNLFCPSPPEPFECGPQGEWSEVLDWSGIPPTLPISEGSTTNFQNGVLAVHAVHLHTGQLLLWQGRLDERAYNLADGTWSWYPLTAAAGPSCGIPDDGSGDLDLFCSGHSQRADGSIVAGGGNVNGGPGGVVTCAFHFDPVGATAVDPAPFDPYEPFQDPAPEPPPTPWDDAGVSPMDEGRWYPTILTLPSGELLAVSGADAVDKEPPEVLLDSGQWVTLPSSTVNQFFDTGFYAFLFVLPDGNVFYAGSETAGPIAERAGQVLRVQPDILESFWDDVDASYPSGIPGGSAVMFEPGKVMKSGGGNAPSAAAERIDFSGDLFADPPEYEPDYENAAWVSAGTMNFPRHFHTLTVLPDGRVLCTGGNTRSNGSTLESASNPCETADGTVINSISCDDGLDCPAVPTVCRTVRNNECTADADCQAWETCNLVRNECEDQRCSFHENLTCTADEDCDPPGQDSAATCAIPGGATTGFCRLPCTESSECTPIGKCTSDVCDPANNACFATKNAELWDSASNTWCLMAAEEHERMYHSTALLLPDARVISMGSGRRQGLADQKNAQIFTPPYLLTGAPRPVITGIVDEAVLHYGGTAVVGIDPNAVPVEDLGRVTLVRLASITHQNNMDQRFVDLGCWTRLADDQINVSAPQDANIAPPGYYMLFVVSADGTPSVAQYVRVGP